MPGAITAEDREFVETWEHISPQRWGITRFGPTGSRRAEVIAGRRNFMITTAERIVTQDEIRDPADDPFLNGAFRPVIVPDSVTILSNPNALSDDEIFAILNTESALAWDENLKTIDSVATVRRMMELADQSDITVKRYRELEARLVEVRGVVQLTYDDTLAAFLQPGRSPSPTGDAPPADDKKRRSGGGRSKDYRETDSIPKPTTM